LSEHDEDRVVRPTCHSADDAADVPALSGWRRELFGEKALALKHGRLMLGDPEELRRAVERNYQSSAPYRLKSREA
jgi:hypothetical protein